MVLVNRQVLSVRIMNVFELWLPIVLSGLATHVLSTLAWMVLPHHKTEWNRLPAENEFQDWAQRNGISSGQYIFPFAGSGSEANAEEFKQKQLKNNGMIVFWSTPINMGKAIALTLAFFMTVAFVIGYLASIAVPAGAPFVRVIQFVTTVALLTHCAGKFPHVFWFRRSIAMDLVDGVLFSAATGLIFAALWPSAGA